MKTWHKVLLGLFIFIGPPAIAFNWPWSFGDGQSEILSGLYLTGLIIGFVLGAIYSSSRSEEKWLEFKQRYTYKRRKEQESTA